MAIFGLQRSRVERVSTIGRDRPSPPTDISQEGFLLNVPAPQNAPGDAHSAGEGEPQALSLPCPCCGGRMIIIEMFERGCAPRYRPTVPNRVDRS
jgi:hypothetical protein